MIIATQLNFFII